MGEFYGSMQDIGLPEILSFLKGLSKTGYVEFIARQCR